MKLSKKGIHSNPGETKKTKHTKTYHPANTTSPKLHPHLNYSLSGHMWWPKLFFLVLIFFPNRGNQQVFFPPQGKPSGTKSSLNLLLTFWNPQELQEEVTDLERILMEQERDIEALACGLWWVVRFFSFHGFLKFFFEHTFLGGRKNHRFYKGKQVGREEKPRFLEQGVLFAGPF